jgi:hypothetical protein
VAFIHILVLVSFSLCKSPLMLRGRWIGWLLRVEHDDGYNVNVVCVCFCVCVRR